MMSTKLDAFTFRIHKFCLIKLAKELIIAVHELSNSDVDRSSICQEITVVAYFLFLHEVLCIVTKGSINSIELIESGGLFHWFSGGVWWWEIFMIKDNCTR